MTTENHENADFHGREVVWSFHRLYGHENVMSGATLLDYAIVRFFEDAEVKFSFHSTREFLEQIERIVSLSTHDLVEQYLNESIEYWSNAAEYSDIHLMAIVHRNTMLKKFDSVLINFMERELGLPIFQIYTHCKNIDLKNKLLSDLNEKLSKYRKNSTQVTKALTSSKKTCMR